MIPMLIFDTAKTSMADVYKRQVLYRGYKDKRTLRIFGQRKLAEGSGHCVHPGVDHSYDHGNGYKGLQL